MAGANTTTLSRRAGIAESAEITSSFTTTCPGAPGHGSPPRLLATPKPMAKAGGALAVCSARQGGRRTHAPNFTPSPFPFDPFDSRSLRSRPRRAGVEEHSVVVLTTRCQYPATKNGHTRAKGPIQPSSPLPRLPILPGFTWFGVGFASRPFSSILQQADRDSSGGSRA